MNHSASREELTAVSLCDLPDQRLLEQAETQDQQDYWSQLRAFYSIVSLCWCSRLLNASAELASLNDPLYEFLDTKEVDRIYYEAVWRRVDRLQAFYKLLEAGEKYIAETVLELGFYYPHSLSSLFTSIIKNDADNLFKVCLEPYKNVSPQNVLTAAKFVIALSHDQPLKPQDIRKSKHLSNQSHTNPLYGLAMWVCAQEAEHDEQLRQLVSNYIAAFGQEAEVNKTAMSRTRDSKTYKRPRSSIWSNGEIVYANRYGGTYDLNKT
ncbi:MAG TPA: hypothetical protein V6C84_30885 [Coleofasciculaceae cyanobacterium]|jgi:hypothetical protein